MKEKNNYKIHKDLEQGSEEWFNVRAKRLTASNAQAIGNNGKGLETYVYKKMAEYFSQAERENYTNEHIERGNELEPLAIDMYEMENDCKVERVGFVDAGEYVGCSPDGLVGDDGLVEIKCPDDYNFYKVLVNGKKEIKSRYLWQIQMQMLVTERDWCDLVYYNPNFQKNLIKFRIEVKEEFAKKLKRGIKKGEKLIKEHIKNYGGKQNKKAEEIFG